MHWKLAFSVSLLTRLFKILFCLWLFKVSQICSSSPNIFFSFYFLLSSYKCHSLYIWAMTECTLLYHMILILILYQDCMEFSSTLGLLNQIERWQLAPFHSSFSDVLPNYFQISYIYKLGREVIESSTAEKNLGVIVDGKLNRRLKCVPRKPTLSWAASKNVWPAGQRKWLCPSTLLPWDPTCVQYCVQFWCSQCKKEHGTIGANPEECHEVDKGARVPSLWKQAEKAGALWPVEEKVV